MQGDEDALYAYFVKSYKTGDLSAEELADVRRLRDRNTSSENMQAMGDGAISHSSAAPFPQREGTLREEFAWFYSWWNYMVFSTFPKMADYCQAVAAWNQLHLCNPRIIAYVRILKGASRPSTVVRTREHWNEPTPGFKIAQPPASRVLHRLSEVPRVERNIGARVAQKRGIRNTHPELRAAGQIIADNIRRFAPKSLDGILVRGGQRYEIRWNEEGSYVSLMRQSQHHTRGPVPVVLYDAPERTLTLVSPSQPTQHGQWSKVKAEFMGNQWATWADPVTPIEGQVPTSYTSRMVWSSGASVDPPVTPDTPTSSERILHHCDVIEEETRSRWNINLQRIRNRCDAIRRNVQ